MEAASETIRHDLLGAGKYLAFRLGKEDFAVPVGRVREIEERVLRGEVRLWVEEDGRRGLRRRAVVARARGGEGDRRREEREKKKK